MTSAMDSSSPLTHNVTRPHRRGCDVVRVDNPVQNRCSRPAAEVRFRLRFTNSCHIELQFVQLMQRSLDRSSHHLQVSRHAGGRCDAQHHVLGFDVRCLGNVLVDLAAGQFAGFRGLQATCSASSRYHNLSNKASFAKAARIGPEPIAKNLPTLICANPRTG